jgi:hypothetical protein
VATKCPAGRGSGESCKYRLGNNLHIFRQTSVKEIEVAATTSIENEVHNFNEKMDITL